MGVLTFKCHLKDERGQSADVMRLCGTINQSDPAFSQVWCCASSHEPSKESADVCRLMREARESQSATSVGEEEGGRCGKPEEQPSCPHFEHTPLSPRATPAELLHVADPARPRVTLSQRLTTGLIKGLSVIRIGGCWNTYRVAGMFRVVDVGTPFVTSCPSLQRQASPLPTSACIRSTTDLSCC
ncbi:hypothetical protein GBF38_009104 [Nibea albiflora]|uniref:Uncharacterized protein n=1 Tax=Nibea albiflora TaxID=240163 RepID=A0ACB7ESD0_NIBAL|nr:hypothetical protein GBF38_009104 [Nibea albiflora]